MGGLWIIAGMTFCALVPFVVQVRLARAGKFGPVLSVLAVVGAVAVILLYATAKPFGIDPVQAVAILHWGSCLRVWAAGQGRFWANCCATVMTAGYVDLYISGRSCAKDPRQGWTR